MKENNFRFDKKRFLSFALLNYSELEFSAKFDFNGSIDT